MTLLNEFEMIEKLRAIVPNITRDAFIEFQDSGVFAPCSDRKKGRPSKSKASGAMYYAEKVEKEVSEFIAGRFKPNPVIGATSGGGETTNESRDNGLDGTSGELGSDREGRTTSGKIIRIEGRIPEKQSFDFEATFGKVETLKEVKSALLKSVSIDVPPNVMKKLQSVYLTMSKDRARREAKKNKISKEKYEADCQKVHETWVNSWSGENGLNAAQSIVQEMERITGKSLQREISNLTQIVHREIVRVSNELIQPIVIKEIEKL